MKKISTFCRIVILLLLSIETMADPLQGGGYVINPHVVASGGGTSTNGSYMVIGTIGQHDAAATVSNGSYQLGSGFWGLGRNISVTSEIIFQDNFESGDSNR